MSISTILHFLHLPFPQHFTYGIWHLASTCLWRLWVLQKAISCWLLTILVLHIWTWLAHAHTWFGAVWMVTSAWYLPRSRSCVLHSFSLALHGAYELWDSRDFANVVWVWNCLTWLTAFRSWVLLHLMELFATWLFIHVIEFDPISNLTNRLEFLANDLCNQVRILLHRIQIITRWVYKP